MGCCNHVLEQVPHASSVADCEALLPWSARQKCDGKSLSKCWEGAWAVLYLIAELIRKCRIFHWHFGILCACVTIRSENY